MSTDGTSGRGRAVRQLALGAAALLALAAYVFPNLEVTTDLTRFLPAGESQVEVALARELALGELSRTLVVLVDGVDGQQSLDVAEAFEGEIASDVNLAAQLAFVEGRTAEGVQQAIWELYLPRWPSFVAADSDGAEAAASDAGLGVAAVRLKDKLSSPLSSMVSRLAPEDPLLVLPGLFQELGGGEDLGLTARDGRFMTADGRAAVLFIGTVAPATDARVQGEVLGGLRGAFERASAGLTPRPVLSMSGAHRFAVRTEQAVKRDMRHVTIGSALGLTILLVVFFRSGALLLLILPVVASAFLAATAACTALFGSIHGLTMAFGAAMIGVAIDFVVHFNCHHSMAPSPDGPRGSLRSIWPALVLSAITTSIGFLVLCVSSLAGLRELAVFGATGILSALIATRVFLPPLTELVCAPVPLPRLGFALVDRLRRLLDPSRSRARLALPSVLVMLAAVTGLPRLQWDDDIANLSRLDADLVAEDEAIRERVVRFEQRRLVVATGSSEEDALGANDRAAALLGSAKEKGLLGGFRGIASLLPSARRQRDVAASFRGAPDLWPRFRAAMESEGIDSDAFDPFRQSLQKPLPPPLTYGDLAASPMASLARPFRVSFDDGGVGFVTFLHGISDVGALTAELDSVPGARLINIEQVIGDAYGGLRTRMVWLLSLGLVLMFGVVLVAHRNLVVATSAYAPAVLAGLGTIGILSHCGITFNLLSVLALLMVVGLGIDYGVILVETRNDEESLDASHFAILVAATSTLVGFVMLSFSTQPTLFVIGITASTGVLLNLVLAPSLCAYLVGRPTKACE